VAWLAFKEVSKMSHNRLAQEKSPYLLQHKNNPVWWFPWGSEAFEQAKKKIKLFSYPLAIPPATGATLWKRFL